MLRRWLWYARACRAYLQTPKGRRDFVDDAKALAVVAAAVALLQWLAWRWLK